MGNSSHALEEQIGSCRQLLDVFRRERQLCLENGSISQEEVRKMLQTKLRLLQVFEEQKELVKRAAVTDVRTEAEKPQLRELAALLEQLLIIDQENEALLRECLSGAPAAAGRSGPSSPAPHRRNPGAVRTTGQRSGRRTTALVGSGSGASARWSGDKSAPGPPGMHSRNFGQQIRNLATPPPATRPAETGLCAPAAGVRAAQYREQYLSASPGSCRTTNRYI